MQSAAEILATLDAACELYAFPMLDNGYLYLAATRMSLFRSSTDWAMVIEVFGFSPRLGLPNLAVATFASSLHDRDPASNVRIQPHDESRYFYPIEDGPWIDEESVADDPGLNLVVRGHAFPLPTRDEYARVGIELEEPARVHVFELSRYVAAVSPELVLATPNEQRVNVLPDMHRLLVLDEWNHPDLAVGQRPSRLASFQQLAEVLSTGDVHKYKPTASPNTHWKHWPDGGTL